MKATIHEPRSDGKPICLEPLHVMESLSPKRIRHAFYVTRSLLFVEAIGDVIDMPDEITVRIDGFKVERARLLTRNMMDRFFQQLVQAEESGSVDASDFKVMTGRYWLLDAAVKDAVARGRVNMEVVFDET